MYESVKQYAKKNNLKLESGINWWHCSCPTIEDAQKFLKFAESEGCTCRGISNFPDYRGISVTLRVDY